MTKIVLYRYSTSNHNVRDTVTDTIWLSYIVILHQTTTVPELHQQSQSCLISLFYIKPQLMTDNNQLPCSCLISLFYIKPQLTHFAPRKHYVVLYRYSTSNHNCCLRAKKNRVVVLYRYSTSNHNLASAYRLIKKLSYIVILHQTTTSIWIYTFCRVLSYIVILHQTTTETLIYITYLLLSYIVILHQTTT